MSDTQQSLFNKVKSLLENSPLQWHGSRDIAYLLDEKYSDVFDVIERLISDDCVWVGYNTDGIRIIKFRHESTVKRCYMDFFPSEFKI
jgi:hypothetical protein